jgi:hypothetical protein
MERVSSIPDSAVPIPGSYGSQPLKETNGGT